MFQQKNFCENDIRPDKLMERYGEYEQRDIEWLKKRKGDYVAVPCPACDAHSYVELYQKSGMDFVRCNVCDTTYITPRPTVDIMSEFYTRCEVYKYYNTHIFPASEEARREKIFKPRVKGIVGICDKFKIKDATLLEVGSGFGIFCEEAKKQGTFNRVIAVEPTDEWAKTCRLKGLEVINDTVEHAAASLELIGIDVVVCFEVLEHLCSPKMFFESMCRIVKKGGIVVVSCPNGKGFDLEMLGSKSMTVNHQHFNYFNTDSLSLLATNCGMEVLEISTPGRLDADIVHKAVNSGTIDISSDPFLRQIFMERWNELKETFQDYLVENKMSSHMWLVARKS